MLYLGHPYAFRDLAGTGTFFSVDHNGGIDFIKSRQYDWPSTTPVVTGGLPMVLGYTTQSVANNPVTLSWIQMTGGGPENWTLFDFESVFTAFREACHPGRGRTASGSRGAQLHRCRRHGIE
jgi:hypothetical protein